MFEWDENKIKEHPGFDFNNAGRVFYAENKKTKSVFRSGEQRYLDFAEVDGDVFVLVYTFRGEKVRPISFRNASRKERRDYYEKLD